MRRTSFEEMNCSVAQTLEVVGEWWTMLIIRDCFLGITRFDDFQQRLGISRNILTDRLDHLVDKGVLVRVPYQANPVRNDYRLTDKGRDLWLVLTAMRQWGTGGRPLTAPRWSSSTVPAGTAPRWCPPARPAASNSTSAPCGPALGPGPRTARPRPSSLRLDGRSPRRHPPGTRVRRCPSRSELYHAIHRARVAGEVPGADPVPGPIRAGASRQRGDR